MDRTLLAWLDDPEPRRGIRFARRGEEWEFWGYDRLARLAYRTAAALVEGGVRGGDVIVVVRRSGPGFVGTFFGTLLAGATPCPAAPPVAFGDPAGYHAHLSGLLGAVRPALVLTEPDLVAEIGAIAAAAGGCPVRSADDLLSGVAEDSRPPGRRPAELALIQFTSGSSGRARGVRVPRAALEANLTAISTWLRHTPDDPTATWLPIHHDMGLIGTFLTPVVNTADVWQLTAEEFVHRPLRYLRCFGEGGARLSAMPAFGLHHILRRVRPDDLAGLDFGRWRAVIVGAERIDADALDRFAALLGPHGLPRRALCPAYGLAEATLLVTGVGLDEPWRAAEVDPTGLSVGARVEPGDTRVVGCGPAIGGVEVSVVDDEGTALPDGHVGEVVVRGASVSPGYLGGAADTGAAALTELTGGVLYSGDAGFLDRGQLFVLGRLGDAIKIRGKALFAEDVEAVLAGHGVPTHRFAVALGFHDGAPTAVVVAEEAPGGPLTAAVGAVRGRLGDARLVVIRVPRGTIPRTSSGKPRRRRLWSAFADGSLAPMSGATT
ncbi:AMP-binding protein [Dactylosporangium sp. NPDC000244]|uniref:AMP-binding protein n=1 Tax=Dactylosporangium sp. NPDC000244 TaxID=3154365 RepID=UPI0033281D90